MNNVIGMNLFTGAREGAEELYLCIDIESAHERTGPPQKITITRLGRLGNSEFGMTARNALRGGRRPRGVIIPRKEWLQRVSGDITDWGLMVSIALIRLVGPSI